MKAILFFSALFFCQVALGQYTIDTSLRSQYQVVFEQLPEVVKKEREKHFKTGLGLLTRIKTDTLNKKEYSGNENPEKDPAASQQTNKTDPKVFSQGEKESVSSANPMWLSCICRFKGDTLEIVSGISIFSGFDVTTSLFKDKAKAVYTEYESENVFKTNLSDDKVNEFSIPAIINNLVLDRQPKKGIEEIYGIMSITSNGYYRFDAMNFKNGYLHKRLKLHYYFRCDVIN